VLRKIGKGNFSAHCDRKLRIDPSLHWQVCHAICLKKVSKIHKQASGFLRRAKTLVTMLCDRLGTQTKYYILLVISWNVYSLSWRRYDGKAFHAWQPAAQHAGNCCLCVERQIYLSLRRGPKLRAASVGNKLDVGNQMVRRCLLRTTGALGTRAYIELFDKHATSATSRPIQTEHYIFLVISWNVGWSCQVPKTAEITLFQSSF